MRSKIFIILAISLVSLAFSACGGNAPSNANNGNTNVANGNSTNSLEPTKATPEQTTNNAPTLTPVFKAYCDAWVKNDEAALRKVYSSDTLKKFEEEMKTEK